MSEAGPRLESGPEISGAANDVETGCEPAKMEEIMAVKELNEAQFDQEIGSSGRPAVVDFWAPWCGPCRMVGPIVEELADQYAGTVDFYKVNVDHNPTLANKFGIQGIPTILFFKNGEVVDGQVGAAAKDALSAKVTQAFRLDSVAGS